jgi:hypothetical protein
MVGRAPHGAIDVRSAATREGNVMSAYPPENDSPNDTPIYSRAVPDPSVDGLDREGQDLDRDDFDRDVLDRDVLDADTPRSFPGVHIPAFGSDTSASGDRTGTADDRSGTVDPFGEPDAIVPEAGGTLSTPPAAAPAPTTAGDSTGSDWSLAATSEQSLAPHADDSSSSSGTASAKADAAKGAAQDVAGDAKSAASDVAGTAKDQVKRVASEATDHAKQLYGQASEGLKEQAGQQQERAAGGLRSLSDQLSSMADKSDDDGIAQKVVRDLSHRAGSLAGFLEGRDPGSLLDEVKSYAARKPGTFIALAAGAGILAGRLTKALAAETKHEHEQDGPTA